MFAWISVFIEICNVMGKAIHLDKAEFCRRVADVATSPKDWKYLGDKPAVVDFFASWCGPCRALSPVLDELAEDYDGRVYIYKVDVDAESDLASTFGVRSVPTLLFLPVGGQPRIVTGVQPADQLRKMIDAMLSAVPAKG